MLPVGFTGLNIQAASLITSRFESPLRPLRSHKLHSLNSSWHTLSQLCALVMRPSLLFRSLTHCALAHGTTSRTSRSVTRSSTGTRLGKLKMTRPTAALTTLIRPMLSTMTCHVKASNSLCVRTMCLSSIPTTHVGVPASASLCKGRMMTLSSSST